MKYSVNNRTEALKRFEAIYSPANSLHSQCIIYAKYLFEQQLNNLKEAGRVLTKGSVQYKSRQYYIWQAACRDANLFTKLNGIETNLGYLYSITNPQYPGWFKLGSSFDAETRLNSYQTASPHRDYKLDFYCLTFDFRDKEKQLLDFFKENSKNEWVAVERKILKDTLVTISSQDY